MDGFHYYDLFATKGIEYLITIAFFLLLIPLWKVLNGNIPAMSKVNEMAGALSFGRLSVPKGLFYSSNHTWAFLKKEGTARVGIDDFLLRAVGEVEVQPAVTPGQKVKKGDLMAHLIHEGKTLNVFAPVSGQIVNNNTSGSIPSDGGDPYQKAWLMELKPSDWLSETQSFYLADQAANWMKAEVERFRDFLAHTAQKYAPEPAMVTLQDGGEPREQAMKELPVEAWQDFQKSFLGSSTLKKTD
jgi:glycine cleavage system H protein